jgi:ADP-heptose:LPS heptosyltransferase
MQNKFMKKILIFPYTSKLRNGTENPKNYPYWDSLVKLLKENNYHVVQVSLSTDAIIPMVDECKQNLTFQQIKELLNDCHSWISIDSFVPHLVNCEKINKQGIVIFSQSNPKIFGYEQNINLLKDKKYLRPDQFNIWEQAKYNDKAYVLPNVVLSNLNRIN